MSSISFTQGSPYPFGATEQLECVNFAIYVKNIKKLVLCIFKENQKTIIQEFELDPLSNKTGDVWHIAVHHLQLPILYHYRVTYPDGSITSLLDPYAKAVASENTWNGSTPYTPLGKVLKKQSFDWQDDTHPSLHMKDLIIYEMHVRGFTNDQSSSVNSPGTFSGIVEKIPYLRQLGINAIELMPIQEFNEKDVLFLHQHAKKRPSNYFGYSPINFFAPMNRYASSAENDQTLNEFKMLVRELHKNGIEVILDVVFNHTGEKIEKDLPLSYGGFDPLAYYMIDKKGQHLNFSGCGNTFNCNHPVVQNLIISALQYWVTEMHVDGFRFDLASIMTRGTNGEPLNHPPLIDAISCDPILAQTKLIAEPWDAAGLYQVGSFAPEYARWAEWNGKYRDTVRRFLKGTPGNKNDFATVISGSQNLYGIGRAPYCSINFVTSHDGFTLTDLVSYNQKHNLENGEENRDGFDHNDSWNCGVEGPTHNHKIEKLRKKQIRNFHLALMISQGVPMILMGDEYCHTKRGNNNTWCQDNNLNWFLWNQLETNQDFYRYYSSLIHFRKHHALFRRNVFLTDNDITWHGLAPERPMWGNGDQLIAFTLNGQDHKPQIYIAFNASSHHYNITLPSPGEGKLWHWVVNTNNNSPDDFYDESRRPIVSDLVYKIFPYSAIMLIV